MEFTDRVDAGKKLAAALQKYRQMEDVVVVGLPRGGVVVAYEVAKGLEAPLDVIIARKIGAPINPEVALGAITENGTCVFNEDIMAALAISKVRLEEEIEKQQRVILQRTALLRQYCKKQNLAGKTVILVDDGLATGATMQAAIQQAKAEGAIRLVVAVPVASREALEEALGQVNEAIALQLPRPFYAVGQVYRDFSETTDDAVVQLLKKQSGPSLKNKWI